MHRFYCQPSEVANIVEGSTFTLGPKETHHAVDVLRVRAGEKVDVHDGNGKILHARVIRVSSGRIELEVESVDNFPLPRWHVELALSLIKNEAFELTIEKVTELGINRIVPVSSERSVVRIAPQTIKNKMERWRQIAIAAMKQCGTPWLPEISEPIGFREFLSVRERVELELVGALDEQNRLIGDRFSEFRGKHNRMPNSVRIWIGPEGDFTSEELSLLRNDGVQSYTLGRNILRAETAAICSIAIVLHEFLVSRPPAQMNGVV